MEKEKVIESFREFKENEQIDRPTLMKVIEEAFRTMIRKKYETDECFDVIVNDKAGDVEIYHRRAVVEDADLENEVTQISLSEAHELDDSLEVGEDHYLQIPVDSFGRRSVLIARQTITSKLSELKKNQIIKNYGDRIGDVITGEVYQIWKKEILLIDDENNELILPRESQIPTDHFKKGDQVRGVIVNVDVRKGQPTIIISRTSPEFLRKLLENEVPEIMDGVIMIRKIVREPGERAKIAVESYDDRIDPVGACVGMKGSRIHGIVRELRNENIDIINFTTNIQLLLQRALTPAKITSMRINNEQKFAEVTMKPDQVSLAIGKKGVNIKLAQELSGYEIEVFRDDIEESEYDIDLNEFSDEIDQWVIDSLKKAGCDTAKSVLALSDEEIMRRADLEESTIADLRRILNAEFEA
jgi:transcription termination/antitermination protein NusA